jgi:hypothetical protein
LNDYEHNWATAAMIQGNLKNFRGRKRRLAQMADDMEIDTRAGGSPRGEDDDGHVTPPPPSPEPSDSESLSDEDEEM